MKSRAITAAVASMLAVTVLATSASAAGQTAQQQAPVESCTVVTEPGTYELGANLTASAADLENASAVDATAVNATAANETGDDAASATGTQADNATAPEDGFTVNNESAQACVLIQSDDVVFEGGGNVITGPAAENATAGNATDDEAALTSAGIAVVASTENGAIRNVSVRNVTVSGFDVGVYGRNTENVSFRNVTASDNSQAAVRVVNGTVLGEEAAPGPRGGVGGG